jgi:uncharacterized protein YjbJ (UPF0337 family)
MNKQEIRGKKEQLEGQLRGAAGRATGDTTEQVKGKAQEIEGTVREAVGKTARKIDEE